LVSSLCSAYGFLRSKNQTREDDQKEAAARIATTTFARMPPPPPVIVPTAAGGSCSTKTFAARVVPNHCDVERASLKERPLFHAPLSCRLLALFRGDLGSRSLAIESFVREYLLQQAFRRCRQTNMEASPENAPAVSESVIEVIEVERVVVSTKPSRAFDLVEISIGVGNEATHRGRPIGPSRRPHQSTWG